MKFLNSIFFIIFNISLYSQTIDVTESIIDFSGGLNTSNPSIYLQNNEAQDLLNVEIDNPVGILKQRKGYINVATSPSSNTITSLYEYSKSNGDKWLILTDNSNIWGTLDGKNFVTIKSGLSNLFVPSFKTIRDKLWIVNTSTCVMVWDGANLSYLDGIDGRPLPPQGNYIEYWKERVWIARTDNYPSTVFFSALTDESGNDIEPSVSSIAWIATNAIYVNREDGSPIYGIKAYKDNLYVFKETGIWAINFESELNVNLIRFMSFTGSKFNDSIVEMDDGLLYFLGKDGIYAFDGYKTIKISDKIDNIINRIKQYNVNYKYKLWDNSNDWIKGSFSSTTYSIYGDISLDYLVNNTSLLDDFSSGMDKWTFYSGNNLFGVENNSLYFTGQFSANQYDTARAGTIYNYNSNKQFYGNQKIKMTSYFDVIGENVICSKDNAGKLKAYNNIYPKSNAEFMMFSNNSVTDYYKISLTPLNTSYAELSLYQNTTMLSSSTCNMYGGNISSITINLDINVYTSSITIIDTNSRCGNIVYNGSITPLSEYKYTFLKSTVITPYWLYRCQRNNINTSYEWSLKGYQEYYGKIYKSYFDDIYISSRGFISEGEYTSEISTFSDVNKWLNFNAESNLSGQNITYFIRSSDTISNLLNTQWTDIIPGNIPSISTSIYTQWKAKLTTYNSSYTPILNNVSVNYLVGINPLNKVMAINNNGRYWLLVSTSQASQYNDTVIVKTRYPLQNFTLYDFNISAITKWNNLLYGSISNYNNIVRLDYGDRDGGNPIRSYWISKDMIFNYPFYYKQINESLIGYEKGDNNISIMFSSDNGNSYETRTLNTSNTNLINDLKRFNFNLPMGQSFRIKIYNDTIDKNYKIFGIFNFGKAFNYKGK